MSKTVCDHCGGPLDPYIDDNRIGWCRSCVFQDCQLLNQANLLDTSDNHIEYLPEHHQQNWALPENIKKVKAIPPKGAAKIEITIPVEPEKVAEPTVASPYDSAWFDRYNGILPGGRLING